MKEKTKKILKGLGLTLGAISLLAVGVGVGACSVKYGSTQTITTTPIRKSLRQNPKKSLDLTKAENLMEKAYEYADGIFDSPNYYNYNANWKVYAWEGGLPSGVYYYEGVNLTTGFKVLGVSNETSTKVYEYSYLHSSGNLTGNNVEYAQGATSGYFYYDGSTYPNLFVNTPFWDKGSLYLIDTLKVDSVNSYYLPKEWFPSSTIVGSEAYPFVSGSTDTGLKVISLQGVYFRSNGVVYDEIEFSWQNARAMAYGVDRTTITADNLWYLSLVRYIQPNGRGDIVYQPKWGVRSDGNTYFDGSYVWVSDVYRNIEVLDYGTSNTLDGQIKDNRQWLNILANGNRTGSSDPQVTDAFGLLSGALGAVFPLLAVQVLPNITLGLLLMLPLIGAIVVLIIKAVKK